MRMMNKIIEVGTMLVAGPLVILGIFYWCYVAWELKSIFMYALTAFPPFSIPMGIYLFFFGVPDWIIYLFG